MASERLQVILELITGNYKREAREAASATGEIGKSAQGATGGVGRLTGSLGTMGGALKNLATGAAAFAIADFAKDSIVAASDLEESMNAVNVVFGEAGEAIHEFGETSVESVGLAAVNVNKSAAVLGSALINVGLDADTAAAKTIELTTRASDMASVFNTTVPDALGAIQSALRGETDPIEKFGVSLSAAAVDAEAAALGYKKVAGNFDTTAKAAARMSLIMKQTDRVAGDFENTADSTANSVKILNERFLETKARIGQAATPAFMSLLEVAEDLLPVIEALGIAMAELGAAEGTGGGIGFVDEFGDTNWASIFLKGIVPDDVLESWNDWSTATRQAERALAETAAAATANQDTLETSREWVNPYADDLKTFSYVAKNDFVPSIEGVRRGLVDAQLAALAAGTAFRDELAKDFLAAALSIEKGSTDIGVSLGKLEARLLENITDQAAFYSNLIILAEAGYGDLAEFLRGQGADEVAGAAADLTEDLERASSLENLIDQTERDADRYADTLARALESDKTRLLDIAQSVGVDLAGAVEAGFSTLELQDLLGIALGAPGLGPVQGVTTTTATAIDGSGAAGYGSGPRAFGGPVSAYKSYLVGERGPEMFVSGTAGNIIPNDVLKSMSRPNTTINVQSPMNEFRSDLQYATVVASLTNLVEGM